MEDHGVDDKFSIDMFDVKRNRSGPENTGILQHLLIESYRCGQKSQPGCTYDKTHRLVAGVATHVQIVITGFALESLWTSLS